MSNAASMDLSVYPFKQNARITILSISQTPEDHNTLRHLLNGGTCQIVTADTCASAWRLLRDERISIVVCDTELPDGTWRNILDYTQACVEKPFLIVASHIVDERLWAEVLNLGGFDLIAKPFAPPDARHVLETAYLGRIGTAPPPRTNAG